MFRIVDTLIFLRKHFNLSVSVVLRLTQSLVSIFHAAFGFLFAAVAHPSYPTLVWSMQTVYRVLTLKIPCNALPSQSQRPPLSPLFPALVCLTQVMGSQSRAAL